MRSSLGGKAMSCFGCCGEDDINRNADGGGQYTLKAAGNATMPIEYLFILMQERLIFIMLVVK